MGTWPPSGLLRFEGTCDASAAQRLEDGRLLVANDEDDLLRVYDPTRGGAPEQTIDLGARLDRPDGDRESDFEGSALLDGITWWIGSHARNRDGNKRANRRVLVATEVGLDHGRVTVEVVAAHYSDRGDGLLGAMLDLPEIGPTLAEAERHPPKDDGGFNIEGLAAVDGELWIGFRNPIVHGRALVLALPAPERLLRGEPPDGLRGTWIDLDGRGIRSMGTVPGRDGVLIAAGPSGVAGPDHALYRWSGRVDDAPQRLDASLGELNLESFVVLRDDRILALSDDGARRRGDGACKDLPPSQRSFRAMAVALPSR